MNDRILYGYWRSSASYRVRIALHLKALPYKHHSINLVDNVQSSDDFLTLNPQGLVPLYVEKSDNQTFSLSQSLAIMEYLDDAYPDTPLLPTDRQQRATVRALAQLIACDIHPLDNLRVLQYLDNVLGVEAQEKMTWYRHWIIQGFNALEPQLADYLGSATFSLGNQPGYLEAVLIPQIYNAQRFDCPLDDYPHIMALSEACEALSAFKAAHPSQQPDAT